MKTMLNKYFDFTRSELNGLLILVALIVLITALPSFYALFKSELPDLPDETAAVKRLILTEKQPAKYSGISESPAAETTAPVPLFVFDPNTLNLQGWQQLGLSAKQAQVIINYRNKGGRFFKPGDLQKMYTIKPALYERLLPYIHIAKAPASLNEKVFNKENQYKKPTITIVDINAADTLQLDQIRGIGAAFARRIVNYRERLGGFYKTAQLMEVYGIDSLKYEEIKDQIKISKGIRKIDINTATFEELKNHPYLRFKQINAIIQYRKQHGNFSAAADLKKIIVLDEATIEKLTPYITF